ncbi:MAG TPA: outer membrane beta-barrel protein [Kofleriaceae bacterium]|nr:outer membrane beta-barrel protein [Kofleriaceae bacterium]
MKCLPLLVLLVAAPAFADDPVPVNQPEPAQPAPPATDEPKPDANAEASARMQELEKRLEKAEQDLADAKDDNSFLEQKLDALMPLQTKLTGYIDLGAFATTGNGAGTRTDVSNLLFPQYSYVPGTWVFYGDPLSTTVNSRGDVADTGESRAVVFDPINSGGKPTALVNAVNLALFSGIGETGQLNASVDLVPRARDISDPSGLFAGDYIDVKLAYGEWRPQVSDAMDLTLQAGKFDSVLGYEYRSLESPDRIGVTPSLICRYTCGRPIGLKARARFLDEALIANVAVTNGSHFSEGFDFASETDTNAMKTFAGRLSYLFAKKVEFGVSGAWGAQDFQPENDVYQWHWGADVHAEIKDFEFTAEAVHGRAKGKTSMVRCDVAPCLRYTGGYVQLAYRATNTWVPYARVDYRDAVHLSGASFVYVSDLWRATLGIRAEIGTRVIAKLEATKNNELQGYTIPNDVVTTSLVLKY